MVDADDLAEEVGEILVDTEVWDAPLEGEAHGTLVGVFLSSDTAVAVVAAVVVGVQIALDAVITAGDVHIEPELEALLVTLGQQQPLGVTTGAARVKLQLGVALHGLISLTDQLVEGDAVRDGHIGIVATAADGVSASTDYKRKKNLNLTYENNNIVTHLCLVTVVHINPYMHLHTYPQSRRCQ